MEFHPASLSEGWPMATRVTCPIGILPKGPYLPCISMAGRALMAGYHRHKKHKSSSLEEGQPVLSNRDLVWYEPILGWCLLYIIIISHFGHCGQLCATDHPPCQGTKKAIQVLATLNIDCPVSAALIYINFYGHLPYNSGQPRASLNHVVLNFC